jgi:hypothetical protein
MGKLGEQPRGPANGAIDAAKADGGEKPGIRRSVAQQRCRRAPQQRHVARVITSSGAEYCASRAQIGGRVAPSSRAAR